MSFNQTRTLIANSIDDNDAIETNSNTTEDGTRLLTKTGTSQLTFIAIDQRRCNALTLFKFNLLAIKGETLRVAHASTFANRAGENGVESIKDSLPRIASVMRAAEPGAKPMPAPSCPAECHKPLTRASSPITGR